MYDIMLMFLVAFPALYTYNTLIVREQQSEVGLGACHEASEGYRVLFLETEADIVDLPLSQWSLTWAPNLLTHNEETRTRTQNNTRTI